MRKTFSINEALDIAIAGETEAHKLYTEMAAMVENPWMCKTLEGLAQEELQHGAKLKAVKAGKTALLRKEVADLGIADTLEDIEPRPGMDYRKLLALAIKKENVSCRLYERLASIFVEPALKELFNKLAGEEADHKRRFEIQYESETS